MSYREGHGREKGTRGKKRKVELRIQSVVGYQPGMHMTLLGVPSTREGVVRERRERKMDFRAFLDVS